MSESMVGRTRYERIRRKFSSAALAASVSAGSPPAWAATEGLDLAWSAPPGCPNEAEMIAAIEQLVGARGVKLPQALWARGAVVEDSGRFRLELSWSTASARAVRTLEGATCAELSQAAALIIALAADPNAEQPPAVSADPSAAGTDASLEPPPLRPIPAQEPPRPPERAKTKPKRESDDRLGVSGRAAMATELGTLPRPSVGVLVGAEVTRPPFRVALDALTFLPVEKEVAAGAGRFWLSASWLRPCWVVPSGQLRFVPCAAVEADIIQSRGQKLDEPDDRWAVFVRLGLTAEALYVLTPHASLLVGGGLLLAPSRPTFVIEDVPVHEPALFSGRIFLGFELRP